jgi:hypothetical protein
MFGSKPAWLQEALDNDKKAAAAPPPASSDGGKKLTLAAVCLSFFVLAAHLTLWVDSGSIAPRVPPFLQ